MGDSLRPTLKQFHDTYDDAFRIWANLCLRALEAPGLLVSCLSIKDAFCHHPYFPQFLRLKSVCPARQAGPRRLYATGFSTWGSPPCKPPCKDVPYLSSFQQRLEIEVAIHCPINLSITNSRHEDSSNPQWFVRPDTNYVPILVLAWAYILSARWAELLANGISMSYTDSRAEYQNRLPEDLSDCAASYVDIGAASAEESRWWAAVLAPGQGWQSSMTHGQHTSPWSTSLRGHRLIVVHAASPSSASSVRNSAVSFLTAVKFLDRFCLRHNISDQSHAALAAVLLLPCFGRNREIQLSRPKLDRETSVRPWGLPSERNLCNDWIHEEHHLDRLLTLSCNIKAIRPVLLSVFYEPQVDCNLVTPWLQGAIAAIDSISHGEPSILGRLFMEREPSVAFLWAGVNILRLQGVLLEEVRRGQIPMDLHSAVWSGTVQSFLQQPVSSPLVADGCVSRADEGRLLYLSQSGQHARVPICQWRPFGVTPVEDVDLEVRVHETCNNHWLQYQSFSWDCVDGQLQIQPLNPAAGCCPTVNYSYAKDVQDRRQILVTHEGLDSQKEAISENATRSVFGWLRSDGWARNEKHLRDHEWFDVFDSDDEDDKVEQEDKSPSPRLQDTEPIKTWLCSLDETGQPCQGEMDEPWP